MKENYRKSGNFIYNKHMRNIGVIIYDLTTEYNYSVIKGLVSYFENRKDVVLAITTIKKPNDDRGYYDYQFWSGFELLKTREMDGYIVVTNSFTYYWEFENLIDKIKTLPNRPIVTIGTSLNLPNEKTVSVSFENCYDQIISHLLNKHNVTNYAYFSASKTFSPESDFRLNSYKKALEKNNLKFNPDLVFPGDFTAQTSSAYVLEHFKKGEKLPFEALLCANDHTALGCITAFESLGIKCPKDLLVVGYDDSPVASKSFPTITTINQNIPKTGYMASKMMDDILSGNFTCDNDYNLEAEVFYRQSCGCVDCGIQTSAYVDQNGVFHGVDERRLSKAYNSELVYTDDFTNIHQLLNMADAYTSVDALKQSINPIFNLTRISCLTVCLYKEPFSLELHDYFELPEKAYVSSIITREKQIHKLEADDDSYFNPRDNLVPDSFKQTEGGTYYIAPLFLRKRNYGYMICKFDKEVTFLIPLFTKVLTNMLLLCYENQKAEKITSRIIRHSENLDLQAKTDELTGIFNRRGFFEFGEKLMDLSITAEKKGVVFFCDMDGLKKINDVYGHKAGDIAVKTQARILKKAFRDTDLIGRLSGDEFGIVAPGFKIENFEEFRERVSEISETECREANLPFTLSISMGYQEFYENNNKLQELLILADKRLYEEKVIKHNG